VMRLVHPAQLMRLTQRHRGQARSYSPCTQFIVGKRMPTGLAFFRQDSRCSFTCSMKRITAGAFS
jgi:hypothetical protein